MRATRFALVLLTLAPAVALLPRGGALAASPGEPRAAVQREYRSSQSPAKPAGNEARSSPGASVASPSASGSAAPDAGTTSERATGRPDASGSAEGQGGSSTAQQPREQSQQRGTLVYQGPPIPRPTPAPPQQATKPEPERDARDEQIESLQAQIDALRGQMEEQPVESAEGAPQLQQLEAQLAELQQSVQLVEQARLDRLAGYEDLNKRLRSVHREVVFGEWQVGETLAWAEWLLGVYRAEAERMGAFGETARIDEALDGLKETRRSLQQEDLYRARVDLSLAMSAIERAREAAMLETSPANQVLGR